MATQNISQLQSYVQSLELATPDAFIQDINLSGFLSLANEDKEAGYVNAGSLVSFVSGVSKKHQEDVLNSTLLAQLAANKKYDREKDTEKWYQFYREVLENVGWVIQKFDFQKYAPSGASFEMNKVVLEILAAIATQNQLAVVLATMQALKGLSDKDNRLVVFDRQSSSSSSGNFQVSTVQESGGVIAMKIGAFYFTVEKNVTRFLWFKFASSKSKVYKGSQGITLNEQIYSEVRKEIIEKLGSNATKYIGNLEI